MVRWPWRRGPAYIKLGQALSIRPDILSPAAMTELQKLCDKVGVLQLDARVEGARFQRLPNGGQGEGLVPPYTRGSISPSLSLSSALETKI